MSATLTLSPVGHEALDDPTTPPALVERMLVDIARSNRWFGGRLAMRAGLRRLLDAGDAGIDHGDVVADETVAAPQPAPERTR